MVLSRCGDVMSAHANKEDDAWCIASVEASHFYHVEPGSLVLMPKHGGFGSRRLIESDAWKPLAAARWAEWHGVRHVAFGDLERVALFQSFGDVVSSCLDSGIGLLVSTEGIVPAESRNDLFRGVKAVNLQLMGFTDAFYVAQTGSQLRPVLETLLHLYHETDCWLEITTRLIPGVNDHPVEIDAMTKWLVKHLGHDVPLHFTCCHGQGSDRSGHVAATETLRRAQKIARSNGHSHVYLEDPDSTSDRDTGCDCCGRTLIVRQKGRLVRNDLVDLNACPSCGMRLQGRFFESSRDPLKTDGTLKSKERSAHSCDIRVKPVIGSAAF